jgi:hypothetical protein
MIAVPLTGPDLSPRQEPGRSTNAVERMLPADEPKAITPSFQPVNPDIVSKTIPTFFIGQNSEGKSFKNLNSRRLAQRTWPIISSFGKINRIDPAVFDLEHANHKWRIQTLTDVLLDQAKVLRFHAQHADRSSGAVHRQGKRAARR